MDEKHRKLLKKTGSGEYNNVIPIKAEPVTKENSIIWSKQPEQEKNICNTCSNSGCKQHELQAMNNELNQIEIKREIL